MTTNYHSKLYRWMCALLGRNMSVGKFQEDNSTRVYLCVPGTMNSYSNLLVSLKVQTSNNSSHDFLCCCFCFQAQLTYQVEKTAL